MAKKLLTYEQFVKKITKEFVKIMTIWSKNSIHSNGLFIRHIDGDRTNNAVYNLALIHAADVFSHVNDWVVDWDCDLTPKQIKFVKEENNAGAWYSKEDYENIWRNVTRGAACGSKYCIIVGDWRRNHIFYDLAHQTERILMKCGFRIFDKVILNYKKITPIVAIPNCKLHGYTSKVHQYLLVFEKPFLPCVQRILRSRRKKLLELFSGTGSVRKVALRMGYDVLSLDLANADLNIDILDWDYKALPVSLFDVIWASPPCHTFSKMRTCHIGRYLKEFGNMVVTKELLEESMYARGLPLLIRTEDIIDYFKPKHYFIENPKSGKMKD